MAQKKKSNTAANKKKNTDSPKAQTKKKESSKPQPEEYTGSQRDSEEIVYRYIGAAISFLLALFLTIGLFSNDGSFIITLSDFIKGLFGWCYWLLIPMGLLCTYVLIVQQAETVRWRIICSIAFPIVAAATIHLLGTATDLSLSPLSTLANTLFDLGKAKSGGGVLGGVLALSLKSALGTTGAVIVLILLLMLTGIVSANRSMTALFTKKEKPVQRVGKKTDYPAPQAQKQPYREEHFSSDFAPAVTSQPKTEKRKKVEILDVVPESNLTILGKDNPTPMRNTSRKSVDSPRALDDLFQTEIRPTAKPVRNQTDSAAEQLPGPGQIPYDEFEPIEAEKPVRIAKEASKSRKAKVSGAMEAIIEDALPPIPEEPIKPAKLTKTEKEGAVRAISAEIESKTELVQGYMHPPVELLKKSDDLQIDGTSEIRRNQELLEEALRSFGISARIVGYMRGPTVTRFEAELSQGVKLARVTNLSGDLALALGVVNVRIAPIPEKISTVGIEVPNRIVATVCLGDIIDSPKFSSAKSPLSFAIGKDISGDCIVGNISKLPHLLIAGTTGSGKSVCMNSLILSLLFKSSPDDVRLIMIDPKMVELGIYNAIPHLYVPVVTDPKKAAGALQWSVVEMLKRYRMFADCGVRDLDAYNRHCSEMGEAQLPRIVIVIDELADLMMAAAKDVEESICRVAQMGRAAGMHLVIATQRPSVNVITGLMKANIPSRIAFAVSSAMESRIILDQGGAEKLIGMGDMLFAPVGIGKPTRIQGAFVSDAERERVINFIKENSAQQTAGSAELESFMNEAAKPKDSKEKGGVEDPMASGANTGDYDDMVPKAVQIVIEMKSCSVSLLQRRLKLGYARAARVVDQLEELGVVGPYEGSKPRGVLMDMAQWEEKASTMGWANSSSLDEYPILEDTDLD